MREDEHISCFTIPASCSCCGETCLYSVKVTIMGEAVVKDFKIESFEEVKKR